MKFLIRNQNAVALTILMGGFALLGAFHILTGAGSI